jgi:hypothetical protein
MSSHTQAAGTSVTTSVVGEAPMGRAFHSNLDRHSDGWEGSRGAVAGDQGWPLYLKRYAALF